jgi:phage terminase Nu1 subunit (DNA packaging protein)
MTKQELEQIIDSQKDLKNLPNSTLISQMDLLTQDFDDTKEKIISMTYYLDKVEELYNNILSEYQNRV